MKRILSIALAVALFMGVVTPCSVSEAAESYMKLNHTSLTLYNKQGVKLKVYHTKDYRIKSVSFEGNNSKFVSTFASGKLEAHANSTTLKDGKAKVIATVKYQKKNGGKWGDQRKKKLRCDVSIKYCGHSYKETVKPPTCYLSERHVFTCSVCKDKYTEKKGEALGHDYKWEKLSYPTCKALGKEEGTCSRCKKKTTRTFGEIKPHEYKWKVLKEPTCKVVGKKKGTCKYCKKVIYKTFGEIKPHEYNWKVLKEPTCKVVGKKKGTCKYCKKVIYKTWLLKHDLTKAAGFSFINKDVDEGGDVTRPTCESEGYTTASCKTCGCIFRILVKKPLGHKISKETVGSYRHKWCTRADCTYEVWELL